MTLDCEATNCKLRLAVLVGPDVVAIENPRPTNFSDGQAVWQSVAKSGVKKDVGLGAVPKRGHLEI